MKTYVRKGNMKNPKLYEYLKKEYAYSLEGWDFSHLNGRMEEGVLPWSYREVVKKYMNNAGTLLDMDTGGGEFLASLEDLPATVMATEGYEPNIPVVRAKLEKKGISVVTCRNSGQLPFEDAFFDVIINRHGSYHCKEIRRLLRPRGIFATQQVGSLNAVDLNLSLGHVKSLEDWCLTGNIREFRREKFRILECRENMGTYRFFDVGAIAWYLRCIPWQIPGFSLEEYGERMELLHEMIEERGFLDFVSHRFYLVAQK
jgi:SAM-dependent methyltransferase